MNPAAGFTPREIAVVMPMLSGRSIDEIAGDFGIVILTARTHHNKRFVKTGTSRQSERVQ